MYKKLLIGLALMSAVACNKSSNTADTTTSSITLSGKVGTVSGSSVINDILKLSISDDTSVTQFAITDYKMYCLTFTSSPTTATSDFGSDGAFSLSLPANTSFGCFINSKSTNLPVAQFVNAGSGSGMSSSKSTAISLASSVDVGSLTLDLSKNTIEIPESALSSAKSGATAGLALSDIDNYQWTMTCVSTGNTEMDNACKTQIMNGSDSGSAPVYLRILSGTQSGATVYGISVWESNSAFTSCGSIDFNSATKAQIETNGFTFVTTGDYAPATATSYSGWSDTTNCPLRTANGQQEYNSLTASSADAHKNLKKNFCLAPMVAAGNGYSFNCDDSGSYTNSGNTCTWMHRTSVTITPGSSASEMYGNFVNSESRSGTGCGSTEDKSATFNIKFVRGSKI